MITITVDSSGKIKLSGEVVLFTQPQVGTLRMGHKGWLGHSTLPYQNVFDPADPMQVNGSATGRFPDAWSTNAVVNPPHRPNIFDVKPGWICNGNGVTNAVVYSVGDATNPIITIAPTPLMAEGSGGFQNGDYYTFTGIY